MQAIKKGLSLLTKPWHKEVRDNEPEPAFAKPREMTGFFSSLTDEQKKKALAYRGAETFGSSEFHKAG